MVVPLLCYLRALKNQKNLPLEVAVDESQGKLQMFSKLLFEIS